MMGILGIVAACALASADKPAQIAVVIPLQTDSVAPATVSILSDLVIIAFDDLSAYQLVTIDDIEAQLGLDRIKDAVGCDDVKCAAEIGGALGVRYLITGSVRKLGSKLLVKLTILDSSEHLAKGRGSVSVENDPDKYEDGIRSAVEKVVSSSNASRPWLAKGCKSPETCTATGVALRDAEGIERDYLRAAGLFRSSCIAGHGPACFYMANLHETGRGVPISQRQAYAFYEKACTLRVSQGCNFLARREAKQGNRWRAFRFYNRACELDLMVACGTAGAYLYEGRWIPEDREQGKKLLKRACDSNNEYACKKLKAIKTR